MFRNMFRYLQKISHMICDNLPLTHNYVLTTAIIVLLDILVAYIVTAKKVYILQMIQKSVG